MNELENLKARLVSALGRNSELNVRIAELEKQVIVQRREFHELYLQNQKFKELAIKHAKERDERIAELTRQQLKRR